MLGKVSRDFFTLVVEGSAEGRYSALMRIVLTATILASALLSPPVAQAQSAPTATLSLEQKTALRCSAAFAIIAGAQAAGDKKALGYPPMAERGQEFFVRFSAGLMDSKNITRDAVAAMLRTEAHKLSAAGEVHQIMPSCLLLLEGSGV